MRVGVPKEVKAGRIPRRHDAGGRGDARPRRGHEVLVEADAGVGSGFPDDEYTSVGAKIVDSAEEVVRQPDMIVKVKEPQPAGDRAVPARGRSCSRTSISPPSSELTRGVPGSGHHRHRVRDHQGPRRAGCRC